MDDETKQLLTDIRDELRLLRTHLEPPKRANIFGRLIAGSDDLIEHRKLAARLGSILGRADRQTAPAHGSSD